MWSNSFKPYSLRDLFRLKSSVKRHRLNPPRNHHRSQHQQSYQPQPAPSRSTYSHTPQSYPNYSAHCKTPRAKHYIPHPKKPHLTSHFIDSRNAYLSNMPPEIHLSIFDTLDPVSSTCLGLTSRKFYPMHRSAHRHEKVSLYDQASDNGLPLCLLLKDWAPKDMVLDWEKEKLVRKGGRKKKYRNFSRKDAYAPEWTGGGGYGGKRESDYGRYCLHEADYEAGTSRLRRSGRLDRHDIWYEGRRY
jgi:hypothetical protein